MPRHPSSGGRGRFRGRNNRGPLIRKNERIRAREVRLIGPDGKQIGIVSSDEARKLAKQVGLDLVEISASARPPVCRILDFGKYKYELSKRGKDKKQTSGPKLKEVKFRVRIEQHDYMTKMRHAEEFLYKGSKLKLSLMFRGRENEHTELGFDVINRAANDLKHVGVLDSPPRKTGRHVNATMSPLPQNKRKLVYNEVAPPMDDDHDEPSEEDHDKQASAPSEVSGKDES